LLFTCSFIAIGNNVAGGFFSWITFRFV
jgi:hypothetical protein